MLVLAFVFVFQQVCCGIQECQWTEHKSCGQTPLHFNEFSNLDAAKRECQLSNPCIGLVEDSTFYKSASYFILERLERVCDSENASTIWIKSCSGCTRHFLLFSNDQRETHGEPGYIVLEWNLPNLSSGLSLCFWLSIDPQLGSRFNGTLVSIWANSHFEKQLSIEVDARNKILTFILTKVISFKFLLPISDWVSPNQVCLTVDSIEGVVASFINGQAIGANGDFSLRRVVFESDAVVTFGENRTCPPHCGVDSTFRGFLYSFNVWGRPLDETEVIANYMIERNTCNCVNGDVFRFIPRSNVENSTGGGLKVTGRASIVLQDEMISNGPWAECFVAVTKQIESTRLFATTQTASSGRHIPSLDLPIALSFGIVGLAALLCLVVWCIRHRKRRLKHAYLSADGQIPTKGEKRPNTTTSKGKSDVCDRDKALLRHKSIHPDQVACKNVENESSPTFPRKNTILKDDHIYAEIQFIPSKNKSPRPISFGTFVNVDPYVYYSTPPNEEDPLPEKQLYELPMESTFVNARATGEKF